MTNRSVVVYFRYLGPSVSDLIFSWGAFDPLWAPFGVLGPPCASFLNPFDSLWAPFGILGLPLGPSWASFGTLLEHLGTQMAALARRHRSEEAPQTLYIDKLPINRPSGRYVNPNKKAKQNNKYITY